MKRNPPPRERTETDALTDEAWTIRLPEDVGVAVERRLPATNFDSVEAYVIFALQALLRELEDTEDDEDTEDTVEVPERRDDEPADADADADADAIQERLESLGYL